ncbi:TonB system transport protein ExbD [Campylobacter sp. MIT 99-7217]|uniref:TonB system transport protein ExbD n=1 Tax=Campylobacter sp. MIT 99-7217 TaxID=535091 RepID=UPI00115780AB|nr:TonB system transport protein ExbD [Campylobacter sp. MIT 99-7217]TQR30360.1 TonB system transport protein ExbD [Campylobacter sp. MIT 99-7217]
MIKLPKNEGLNIVPFIDIMLVLLAIVLSISTFIAHGQIKVELPKSEFAESSSDEKKKLLISVDENNVFYLDDKTATLDEVKEAVNTLDKEQLVELKSDKNSKFESFVQIIDILKGAKHTNFQIITERQR